MQHILHLVRVTDSPTAVTRPLEPQESVPLPPGIPNALQHLLLYCELDFTSFSVPPLAHAQASQQTHGHLCKCHELKDQQCKYESAMKTDSSSRYKQEHFLKQSCTSLEHAKANESFAEELSGCGSAILTALHQML